jgi:FkbM family methyltransferase
LCIYLGERGCVYTIEPIPLTFEILSNNVKKLGLSNVRLFNCGISDNDVSAIMEVPKFDFGADNFYQAKIIDNVKQDSSLKHFEINLKSLDSLLNDRLNNIRFIKIDVEGHELQVVNGARQLIKHSKPALYIEVSDNPDDAQSSTGKLFDVLNDEGYLPYCLFGNMLKRRTNGSKSVNYFFLTDDQFNKLQVSTFQKRDTFYNG